jgi:hypothetical protein
MGKSRRFDIDLELSKPARLIGKRPLHDPEKMGFLMGLQLADNRPGEKRPANGKRRVLGRRADQDNDAGLHIRHQDILLSLVETMDLIDKKDGFALGMAEEFAGLVLDLSHFRNIGEDGIDLDIAGSSHAGDHERKRRLTRSRRTIKDQGAQAVGFPRPSKKFPRTQQMLLPDNLIDRSRPHPHRKRRVRRDLQGIFDFGLIKEFVARRHS